MRLKHLPTFDLTKQPVRRSRSGSSSSVRKKEKKVEDLDRLISKIIREVMK